MKYEVELTFPLTVEFEIPDEQNPSEIAVRSAARARANAVIAEMDHFDRMNWVGSIASIKEDA
tara:strand:- start:179 stop:367 length:189 start_codon:yes stop_codon:yes gene_type:complete